jgi:hypothetical protein
MPRIPRTVLVFLDWTIEKKLTLDFLIGMAPVPCCAIPVGQLYSSEAIRADISLKPQASVGYNAYCIGIEKFTRNDTGLCSYYYF